MREAVLKATCDKGVHQKRLNAVIVESKSKENVVVPIFLP